MPPFFCWCVLSYHRILQPRLKHKCLLNLLSPPPFPSPRPPQDRMTGGYMPRVKKDTSNTNWSLLRKPAADAVNWTAQGAVTPVKDQGQVGETARPSPHRNTP